MNVSTKSICSGDSRPSRPDGLPEIRVAAGRHLNLSLLACDSPSPGALGRLLLFLKQYMRFLISVKRIWCDLSMQPLILGPPSVPPAFPLRRRLSPGATRRSDRIRGTVSFRGVHGPSVHPRSDRRRSRDPLCPSSADDRPPKPGLR